MRHAALSLSRAGLLGTEPAFGVVGQLTGLVNTLGWSVVRLQLAFVLGWGWDSASPPQRFCWRPAAAIPSGLAARYGA